jgi:hypothetical protein
VGEQEWIELKVFGRNTWCESLWPLVSVLRTRVSDAAGGVWKHICQTFSVTTVASRSYDFTKRELRPDS